ncbi:MAG TPA: hypothetical protein VHU82_00965 [Vicinamibacterales bacterium]|nr:hypothetical protein [Vicinamibacterales bacterium]
MPFLRFSRDKRGYENFYLVEPTTRRGRSRTRILYWFRTPPGVKVGRLPFDEPMRRALEARYPKVAFEWQKLIDTPIPPPAPDVERWRERRRLERVAKQAAASEAAADNGEPASEKEPIENPAPAASSALPSAAIAGTATPPARRKRRRSGRRGRSGGAPSAPADANGPGGPASETTAENGATDRAGRNEE